MRVQSRQSPVLKGQVANGEDRFWQGPKWNDGYAFGNEDQRGVLAIGFMRSLVGGGPFCPNHCISFNIHAHLQVNLPLQDVHSSQLRPKISYLIETPQ